MNNSIQIIKGQQSQTEMGKALLNKLIRFNTPTIGAPDYNPVVLVIERDGELIGGLSGYSLYGWLCVEVLWVAEPERRQGLGRALMSEVEALALKRRCAGIYLDTFDFQAPGFYEKLGYRKYGQLSNWPGGHQRLCYCKMINVLPDT
jgi:GNAT superfamily N-acetyltransferase